MHVPTTVVAQVDSAIGGKTGVDLPEGKNLVGAFYPPQAVIADSDLLATLPHREYRSGLYEVVKYGVIADAKLFEFLERRMQGVLRRDPAALDWIIPRCAAIKARVVSADEREGGLRQILNFGHTMGHALEAATGYRRFLHGEAIGWGMIYATCLSLAAGRLGERDAARIIQLIASVGPLPALGNVRLADCGRLWLGTKRRAAAACYGCWRGASARPNGDARCRGRLPRERSRTCRRLPQRAGRFGQQGRHGGQARKAMTISTEEPTAHVTRAGGSRPEGTSDAREASTRVQEMFTRIAPRYDFLNHLLSFGLDHVWRWRTARRFREVLVRPEARVLDICCGTGDLAFALARVRAAAARKAQGQGTPGAAVGGQRLRGADAGACAGEGRGGES